MRFLILVFLVKIYLHVHYALPVARLVIPFRGPARSSAALHDGLLRTHLLCNHAYNPLTGRQTTLDYHVL